MSTKKIVKSPKIDTDDETPAEVTQIEVKLGKEMTEVPDEHMEEIKDYLIQFNMRNPYHEDKPWYVVDKRRVPWNVSNGRKREMKTVYKLFQRRYPFPWSITLTI